jgi:hypothetical protein
VIISELQARLQEYDVTLASSTIRKLAHERIITPPLRYHKSEGKGRGGPTNWHESAVGEIVAFWVLTHDPMRGATPKSTIRYIRSFWEGFHDDAAKLLHLSVEADGIDGDNPFVGSRRLPIKSKSSLTLFCFPVVARWIATVQKVQDGLPIDEPISLRYVSVLYKDQNGDIEANLELVELVEPPAGKNLLEDEVALVFSLHKPRRPAKNASKGVRSS